MISLSFETYVRETVCSECGKVVQQTAAGSYTLHAPALRGARVWGGEFCWGAGNDRAVTAPTGQALRPITTREAWDVMHGTRNGVPFRTVHSGGLVQLNERGKR
jgi:hypothetical protein